jgi:hypothetical protein
MPILNRSFTSTKVATERSAKQLRELLSDHGIRSIRVTDDLEDVGNKKPGMVMVEFLWSPAEGQWLAARCSIQYQASTGSRGGQNGTTVEMAYRALFWHIKAKLDSVDWGISTMEREFFGNMITCTGQTVADMAIDSGMVRNELATSNIRQVLALPYPSEKENV